MASSRFSSNAYERHKHYINDYILFYGGEELRKKYLEPSIPDSFKTEYDVIMMHHKFIHDNDSGVAEGELSWEARLAKRYYDKLFKEYCLADLSRYKEGKVAMRWRTQQEVFDGKGQLICGQLVCNESQQLVSYEVNFGYVEEGTKKNALVKLRLCSSCGYKLNYRKEKDKRRELKTLHKMEKRAKRQQQEKFDNTFPNEEEPLSMATSLGTFEQKEDTISSKKRKESHINITISPNKVSANESTSEHQDSDQSFTANKQKRSKPIEQSKTLDNEFDEFFHDLFA